jgi:N utilization substance protein B
MKSRRKAREAVLQMLYSCDTLSDWSMGNVEAYFAAYQPNLSGEVEADILENINFAKTLIAGIFENQKGIDELLAKASLNWSLVRMSRVDRNILRLAAYEISFCPEIPVNVTINEAIEIAKSFSSDESSTFINGVLDKIAGNVRSLSTEPQPDLLKKAV